MNMFNFDNSYTPNPSLTDDIYEEHETDSLINDEQIKDTFLIKLYYYYIHKGYYNIISTQIVNIIITIFLYTFILFLVNCIDYIGLFQLDTKANISNYINWDNLLNLNIFGWFCFGILIIFLICRILSLLDDMITYLKIRKYYNTRLYITDSQLVSIDWSLIVNKLSEITECKYINVYTVSSKVMAKENFLISLIDNKIITLDYMTKLMEWNILFCVINTIFTNNKINLNLYQDSTQLNKLIKIKLKAVSLFNMENYFIIIQNL